MIAAASAADIKTLPAQAQPLSGGNTCGNTHVGSSVKGGDLNRCTEGCLPWRNRNLDFGVIPLHSKCRVRILLQADIEIAAVWTAIRNADPAVVASAGRNANINCFLIVANLQTETARGSVMHVRQRQFQFSLGVHACGSRLLTSRPPAPHSTHSSEHHLEEIAKRSTAETAPRLAG